MVKELTEFELESILKAMRKEKKAERALVDILLNNLDKKHGLSASQIKKLEEVPLIPKGLLIEEE